MSPRGGAGFAPCCAAVVAAASAIVSRNAAGLLNIYRYVIHPRMRPTTAAPAASTARKHRRRSAGAAACALVCSLAAVIAAWPAPADDAALDAFLAAESRTAAARLVDGLVARGVRYDDAFRVLRRGRAYGAAKTGVVPLSNRTADGVEHHY